MIKRVALMLGLVLLPSLPQVLFAHALGVDRGTLEEIAPGEYELTAKVPPRLAPAIRTPRLPEQCRLSGKPNGERGSYSVRFSFSCEPALTADEVIALPWRREGVLLTTTWLGKEPVTRLASREGETIDLLMGDWLAGSGSILRAAWRYFVLGVEHILAGLDHLLFVLALIFVVSGGWMLVKTITAFTVAHSITLGLATFGHISLPSAPVEAAIALSIVFLASELVHRQRGRTSLTFEKPWLVAFAFGLLHGLGFAGALSEIGLPPDEIPVALLFFNVGVEAGQLLFVAMVLGLLWALARVFRMPRGSVGYRRFELALVYSIGVLASYWLLERTGGMLMS